ncbi:MAG: (Na+)-NQR maturation NqrM [Pseudomonadota bacterium]
METFIFAFAFFMLVVVGMAVGVMLQGKTIKGSCGGLNAISDSDKCMVCSKDIDPDSPLRDRLASCPRARKASDEMQPQVS